LADRAGSLTFSLRMPSASGRMYSRAGEDGVRMTVLAREVVVTKADLTKMIDRLEHKGLVARTADPRDRRAIRVTLIGEGAHLPGRGHGAPGRDPWALRRPHVRIRGAHQCRGVQWRPAVQPVGHQRQLTPSRPSERKQAARLGRQARHGLVDVAQGRRIHNVRRTAACLWLSRGDGAGVAGARVDRDDECLPASPRIVGGWGGTGASQPAGAGGCAWAGTSTKEGTRLSCGVRAGGAGFRFGGVRRTAGEQLRTSGPGRTVRCRQRMPRM